MHGMTYDDITKLAKATQHVLGFIKLGHSGDVFALRARREHLGEIRNKVQPQGITLHEGTISTDGKLWTLSNCYVSTTCTEMTSALRRLNWDATAIRPSGRASWLICSPHAPPALHLKLGSDFVTVMPHKHPNDTKRTDPQVCVAADCSFCPEDMQDDSSSTTTATRISDMRTDLEDRLTRMINDRITGELQGCHERIDQVANGLGQVQKDVQANAEYAAQQFHNIDTTMATNQSGLLNQMQQLFTKMQSELDASIATRLEQHDPKRTKLS